MLAWLGAASCRSTQTSREPFFLTRALQKKEGFSDDFIKSGSRPALHLEEMSKNLKRGGSGK